MVKLDVKTVRGGNKVKKRLEKTADEDSKEQGKENNRQELFSTAVLN